MAERALSLTQPWALAITRLGKRIENREAWRGCTYRGPIWLHASATKGRAFDEHAEGLGLVLLKEGRHADWCALFSGDAPILLGQGAPWRPGAPYRPGSIPMGAIVGHARIVDVIAGPADFERWVNDSPIAVDADAQRAWWFGGFALVLDDVVEIEPVPCKGALGLWRVPEQIEADARAALEKAVRR